MYYSLLQKYIDAESAFEEVLRLDTGCREAQEEIRKVRIIRIVEMGFTERQANSAIAKYKYVQVSKCFQMYDYNDT